MILLQRYTNVPILHTRHLEDCPPNFCCHLGSLCLGRGDGFKCCSQMEEEVMPTHSHKNHLRIEKGVERAESKAILLFALILMFAVIIWGFFR